MTSTMLVVPVARDRQWPNLVWTLCSCGWIGPIRNIHLPADRVALEQDQALHACCEVAS
jgi:hypothetical protein